MIERAGDIYRNIYEKQREKIEDRISKLLIEKKPVSLYEPCSYIIQSGGKRLRPLLVLLSAKAVGGEFRNAYNAAVAIELLHNFTLVHDDIMDNADKRRGRPTLHKKYDLSTAILAGDNLLGVAYKYLLKDCRDNDKSVLYTFTNGVIEVCEGQSMDKDFETQENVTIGQYLVMIEKKTAALLETCCSIGSQIGGGDDKKVKSLSRFGKYLGMAFQLQDDLLDITADEKQFGKVIGGDLVEGKKTFLFLKAMEKVNNKNDRNCLLEVIKNKGIRKSRVPVYRELYYKLGVIEDTQAEILRYTRLAKKETMQISNKEDKGIFNWLADSLIKRIK